MRLCTVLLVAACIGTFTGTAGAAEPTIERAKPGSLEQYLASRLLVTNPADKAFLDEVTEAVQRGDLPESLVRGTCEWAAVRSIRQGVRYPFPSFRKALEIKSRRLGVDL